MSAYVTCVGMSMSMSTHVSCVSMSMRTLVYKEGFLLRIVFFFFLAHATSCILFGQ